MMTKQDFIALADAIRAHNADALTDSFKFDFEQLDTLAAFCLEQNPQFNRERWLSYIHSECGPNGGAIHKPKGSTR